MLDNAASMVTETDQSWCAVVGVQTDKKDVLSIYSYIVPLVLHCFRIL